MSGYNPIELGELQQRILKHFFDCEGQQTETVSHLSRALGTAQPAVFKSVNLLIEQDYLIKDRKFRNGKKTLLVTDKGAAAAVVLGVSYDKFANYHIRLNRPNELQHLNNFERLFRVPDRREFLVRKMSYYLLRNNLYEKGWTRWLSQNERKLVLAYLSVEYNKAFGNVHTIKGLIDKYGIDKELVRHMFERDRKRIDSIIKRLES
jgi:hypothetical protein